MIERFAIAVREKIKLKGGGYRRDHLRALAQRVEIGDKQVRIIGSKSRLLKTLNTVTDETPATIGVPGSVPKWRRDRDSNPGDGVPPTRVPGVRLRPLGHLSEAFFTTTKL